MSFLKGTRSFPRIGIACIVLQKGKILLGKRRGSHATDCWGAPGGHLEFGENVEDCAARELLEETGLKALSVRAGPWVENLMDNGTKHYVTIFAFIDKFEGRLCLLEPHKCAGWEWFDIDSLPTPLFLPIPSLLIKYPNLLAKNVTQKL